MSAGQLVRRLGEAVVGWQDPLVRHQRAVRRAETALRHRMVAAAALAGAAAILVPYAGLGLPDVGWVAAAAGCATSAALAARRLRMLRLDVPLPALPRRSSAARPGIDRLARAAGALRGILARLGPLTGDTVTEAAAAERFLRDLAARVDAIESALPIAPAEDAAGLWEARQLLLGRLAEGTDAYERLVAVAAHCLAAGSAGPLGAAPDLFALRRLEEATDRLRGLAAGWHEVHGAARAAGL
ncbi:MAG: hypothetical protein M3042_06515 [Actinomycetota bacterium]|nr:hypothetical protein [Actinomycetota bacterium]